MEEFDRILSEISLMPHSHAREALATMLRELRDVIASADARRKAAEPAPDPGGDGATGE